MSVIDVKELSKVFEILNKETGALKHQRV